MENITFIYENITIRELLMYILNSTNNDKIYPAVLLTASNRHVQETKNYSSGMRSSQILIITEGRGTLEHNGSYYPLKKGCAFFTAPNIPIKYTNEDGLISIFVTANGCAIQEICNKFEPSGFAFFESVNTDKILSDINTIEQEFCSQKRQSKLSILAYAFFLEFFESNAYNNGNYLAKIMDFIDKNYTKQITLEEIAKECGVSVSKLCYDFKTTYGITVFSHVINLRLNYARSYLLYASELRVKDVAAASGFEDVSYFCKAYKNKYGVSPSMDMQKN